MNAPFARDGMAARLLVGTVMHERLRPVRHAFAYPIFQVCCDVERLDEIDAGWFGIDRWLALASRDYGRATAARSARGCAMSSRTPAFPPTARSGCRRSRASSATHSIR